MDRERTDPESYAILESFDAELDRVDPELLDFYVTKLQAQLDKINPGEKVGLAFHPDADGIFACLVVLTYLRQKNADVKFLPYELETKAFEEGAKECQHVISTDLWIRANLEGQRAIENVLDAGVNMSTIDHHDRRFPPRDIREDRPENFPRDERFPETIGENQDGKRKGDFMFVTPNRLECEIKNSNRYPASTLTYKLFLEIAKRNEDTELMEALKELEPYIMVGIAGDCSLKAWPKASEDYKDQMEVIQRLGVIINLAENFRNPENVVLQAEEIVRKAEGEKLKTLQETSPELAAAEAIQQWVERRVKEIQWDKEDAPVLFHFHVGDDELEAVNEAVLPSHGKVLNDKINPNIAIANALSREIGKKVAIVVTQYCESTNGQPPAVVLSFRTESAFIDTRVFANALGGGDGHPMASASKIHIIENPKDPEDRGEAQFASVEGILRHISSFVRNMNRQRG